MPQVSARDALSNAVRYSEPRRILFNAVLLAVVVAVYVMNLPASRANLTFDSMQALFVLAVLANVAYCAAYIVDVPLQVTSFRAEWLKFRWALLLLGVAFASVLANFLSHGFFYHSP